MISPKPIRASCAIACLASLVYAQPPLRSYESKYYVIHTDLGRDELRAADQRITAMAEEFYKRTKGFSGRITRKLPFYLFSKPADYYAAGGLPGSAGVFNGKQLMAIAGSKRTGSTWHIIQHEGFHQFAHAVIGGDIPVWMNEGLAEYFGESLYTGDAYVTGVAPPRRIKRLQTWIKRGNAISIREMMQMPHMLWNAQMSIVNYDQAWSMVYFLAHGDGGRYQKALNGFLRDVSRGASWERAWQGHFGAGTRDFEKRWKTYWLGMKADHSAETYAEATVATLTSFYARAFAEQQIFRTWPKFADVAKRGALKSDERDWLSPELLKTALARVNLLDKIEIRKRNGYQLVARTKLGTELIGTFRISNKRVRHGSVKVIVRRCGG